MPRHPLLCLMLSALFVPSANAGELADKLRTLDARVIVLGKVRTPPLASMLQRDTDAGLRQANRANTLAWEKVQTLADWKAFRDVRLKALKGSLGTLPLPGKLNLRVTGSRDADGYRVDNLVYESRGLLVTANLYRPTKPAASMPCMIIVLSHQQPKHVGARQDMGMTWARAGCVVLIHDHLGTGERKQHPFGTASESAPHDYHFRYDLGIQLHLVGESLMGWLAYDLMRGVDLLLAHPGVDARRMLHMDGDGWRGAGLNWKGWFPADAGDDASRHTVLVFHIRQVTKVADADLNIQLLDNVKRDKGIVAGNEVSVLGEGGLDKIDGQWRRVVIPLNRFTLNKPLHLSKLWEIDFSNLGRQELTFHIDNIGFAVEKVTPPRFKNGPAYKATARVFTEKELHKINDGIYGVCGLPRDKLQSYDIRITRWGGNPSTRYNWKLGVANAGNDWYFKNTGKVLERISDSGYLKHIEGNQVFGATTYQTVPMAGWVAKDATSHAFSIAKYGAQKAHEPGGSDVGNGVKPAGGFVTNDPRDTSIEAPPAFIEEAVRFVVKRAGKADGSDGQPGVKYWCLDNEPMIWHATHRDVHPEPCSYDELWDRTVKYAEAIKRADPSAKVAGFCSWGWTDLYYSALDQGKDNYRTKPDWLAHGKVGLGEWFIQKCAEYKKKHGKALIDVFDFHWYPQGNFKNQGVYLGRGLNPEFNALRMRSTRDLWDATYQQESWIKGTDNYSPVALLPRVRGWIDRYNPGMELCLGEYNFGGGDNITGGLAQAEAFGVFAQEKLDLAFIWYNPTGTQELAWKLFRNYDGKGGRFGDAFLKSQSDNPDLSVFAARRSADGALTLVIVNKNLHGPCELTLDVGKLSGPARVWRFDQETEDRLAAIKELVPGNQGRLSLTLPAASANMVVLK